MVKIDKLMNSLKMYANSQLQDISKGNPALSFFYPVLTRAIHNSIDRAYSTISLLADKDGNIDIEELISEMSNSLINTQPFSINTGFMGDIIIGNGSIKVTLPYVHKDIVFNSNDLDKLRELLSIKVD